MNKNLELALKLSVLNTKMTKSIDAQLSIHGITFSEFLVIYHLANTSTKTMRRIDLAEKVAMSASGITRMLNPMEKLKIVQKEVNPRDARVSFVKLTSAGEELYKNALKSVNNTTKELFEDLYNFDIDQLYKILKKI